VNSESEKILEQKIKKRNKNRRKSAKRRERIRLQLEMYAEQYRKACDENTRLKQEIKDKQTKLFQLNIQLKNQMDPSEYEKLVVPVLNND